MISNRLYIPNYAIGQMIAAQIEGHITRVDALGVEFERMCRTGNVTPDMWMKVATGDPVGPQALLRATERALKALGTP
jgi:Zn-dependent M32 family carboxypeptidase